MKKFPTISKSLIHTYNDFKRGELCGSVLKAKYIDRTWQDDWGTSPAMKLGNYFEAVVYNQLGFKEDIPEPEMMKSGKDMLEPYRLATQRAHETATLIKKSGIKVKEVQTRIEYNTNRGRGGHGVEDIEATYRGRTVTIDLKYSGLIDDKWARMGWGRIEGNEEQREYHSIQAHHYNFITGKPFYYLVVSSAKKPAFLFLEMKISKYEQKQHAMKVNGIAEVMETLQLIDGFDNYPSYNKCSVCPLATLKKGKCPDAQLKLKPIKIETRS
jgi:hypothetical protein